jgi:hypothetical protein
VLVVLGVYQETAELQEVIQFLEALPVLAVVAHGMAPLDLEDRLMVDLVLADLVLADLAVLGLLGKEITAALVHLLEFMVAEAEAGLDR